MFFFKLKVNKIVNQNIKKTESFARFFDNQYFRIL